MISPSWVKFHNSHSFTGMTNDVRVRDTRPQQPHLGCFFYPDLRNWNPKLSRPTQNRSKSFGENEFSSPGVIITGITITKQMNIQLPNLGRGRQWEGAALIIRTSACSRMQGWFELTPWTMPVTLRVNHRFDAVYKQSFILSITLWSAVCEQVVQVFLPQRAQVRTGSARQGAQWWLQPIVCPAVTGLTD